MDTCIRRGMDDRRIRHRANHQIRTNLALTRILVPELFGIMMIVNTVRTGIELLSDIGIAQSVIRSSRGEQPVFYNTAWTLQVARGAALFLLCALWPYQLPRFTISPFLFI